MIVFVLGFMGSGKSFYGEGLSEHLHIPSVDLDQFIEKEQGMTISEIFEKLGESVFRTLEAISIRKVYTTLLATTNEMQDKNDISGIISCGGGTPCFNDNMDWMNKQGLTVWINPTEEIIWNRLVKENKTRPLVASLNEDALKEYIHQKFQERKPFYEKAQVIINQSEISILELVNTIKHAKKLF